MTTGKPLLSLPPSCMLGAQTIENVSSLEILGVTISSDLNINLHAEKRIQACRKAMFSLSTLGYSSNGLAASTKTYLWKSIGLPTLSYGLETQYIIEKNIQRIESAQNPV